MYKSMYAYRHAHMSQTHSMLECGEFIQHTAHGPDVTAQNSTRNNKNLTRHHCNLKKVYVTTYIHMHIRTYIRTYH